MGPTAARSTGSSLAISSAASAITVRTRSRSSVAPDLHVDAGGGPALAEVADPLDLAVADVPDLAVVAAQLGHPQADLDDLAGGDARVDGVADAVLVLQDHEDAGEEVGDQVAGAETDRHARDTGARPAAGPG